MENIAIRFHELRTQQNLTLKELSEKTGLSISFLSQIERGTSSLAITSLKKIAEALHVPITVFFNEFANHNFHMKLSEQKSFQIEGSSAEYTRLNGEFSTRVLEPLIVTLMPGQCEDQVFNHPGEEFYFVLQGAVIFNVDSKEYLLKTGESIHYPSNLPHFWSNPLDQKSKVLCVLTPVLF